MSTSIGTEGPAGRWEAAVGRRFVEALNEGLSRSTTLRTRASMEYAREARLVDPFAAAVMTAYEEALDGVLAPAEREDPDLRAELTRRGRRILAEASAIVRRTPQPPGPLAAHQLPQEQEALVCSLLMECAALQVLAGGPSRAPESRSTELIKELAARVRSALTLAGKS